MPRSRMQFLTEELATKVDRIRSATPPERKRIAYDVRMILDRTLDRILHDVEDLHWFINRPDDYDYIYREELGSRFEAIMPRGPPQDRRQYSQEQQEKTLAKVRTVSEKVKEVDAHLDSIIENLELLGLIYMRRRH